MPHETNQLGGRVVGQPGLLGPPNRVTRINCGALPNATSKTVAHGIVNLGTVLRVEGVAVRAADGMRIVIPNGT